MYCNSLLQLPGRYIAYIDLKISVNGRQVILMIDMRLEMSVTITDVTLEIIPPRLCGFDQTRVGSG